MEIAGWHGVVPAADTTPVHPKTVKVLATINLHRHHEDIGPYAILNG